MKSGKQFWCIHYAKYVYHMSRSIYSFKKNIFGKEFNEKLVCYEIN